MSYHIEIDGIEGNEVWEEEYPADNLHPIKRTLKSVDSHSSIFNLKALIGINKLFFT